MTLLKPDFNWSNNFSLSFTLVMRQVDDHVKIRLISQITVENDVIEKLPLVTCFRSNNQKFIKIIKGSNIFTF